MYDTTGELVGILRATPDILRGLLREITPERVIARRNPAIRYDN